MSWASHLAPLETLSFKSIGKLYDSEMALHLLKLHSVRRNQIEVKTMALLEKWNPSREIERFRRDFDDLLEKVGFERGGSFFKDWESMTLKPALESFVDGDKFTVIDNPFGETLRLGLTE